MASSLGFLGEKLAADFLQERGYTILHKNFRSRGGEIDLICQKDSKIIFVEVKTRSSTQKGMPYESVTALKLHHLKFAIYYFLQANPQKDVKYRVDVISILLDNNRGVEELKHYENVEINIPY